MNQTTSNESGRAGRPRRWKALLLVLVALAVGWWSRGALEPVGKGTPSAHGAQERTEHASVWTCSMHPQIRLPRPGPCPICSMDLIPVEDDMTTGGLRRIRVGPDALARMRLASSPVERRAVEATIRLVGKIDYDETRVATITARVAGRIERLFVDYTGIEVKEGDHLVELFSPKLYAAQAELLQALEAVRNLDPNGASGTKRAESARTTLDATRERLGQLGLTSAQVSAVERRGTPSDRMTILAPIGGIVLEKDVRLGTYLDEGTRISTIADLDHLWVVLDAHESDLMWLRYGQTVVFTTPAYPGEEFEGTIAFIDPVLDDRTRTVKIRVNVANEARRLKPNMFVKASVRPRVAAGGRVMDPNLAGKWICPMHPEIVGTEEGACTLCGMELVTTESLGYVPVDPDGFELPLVVPSTAPLATGKRAIVFVEVPGTDALEYEGREIALGPRAGDWYIVKEGLAEGERVVTHGNFKLDSAMQILARPSMMTTAPRPPAPPEQRTEAPAAFVRGLSALWEAYLGVQAALARDDHDAASTRVTAARDALELLSEAASAGPDWARPWRGSRDELVDALGGLEASTELDQARLSFESLSGVLTALLQSYGPPAGTVYELHCPMAFERGANWLQDVPDAANPYLGKSMPRCGSVARELGAHAGHE